MPAGFYRFIKTETERLSILKGEDSWFEIRDADDAVLHHCHVVGSCLGGTSTFHPTRDSSEVSFRLEPKWRFLTITWYVAEGRTGPRLATLKLFASRGMKIADPDGRELYRIVDPQSGLDKIMQDMLDGCCSEYAVVRDDELIGEFARRERPHPPEPKRKGLLGRLLRGVQKVFLRDWCLELHDDGGIVKDHRPLLAGLILLQEQTIRMDQAASS